MDHPRIVFRPLALSLSLEFVESLAGSTVLVSVKGGHAIYGAALHDFIVRKVEGIQVVLFRTVEMLLERPFRQRVGPPGDVKSMFRPWIFQAPAGSYQFAVRVQEPEQIKHWEADRPKVECVTTTFFRVPRATTTADPRPNLPPLFQMRSIAGLS
jgi:hypothetical protein